MDILPRSTVVKRCFGFCQAPLSVMDEQVFSNYTCSENEIFTRGAVLSRICPSTMQSSYFFCWAEMWYLESIEHKFSDFF